MIRVKLNTSTDLNVARLSLESLYFIDRGRLPLFMDPERRDHLGALHNDPEAFSLGELRDFLLTI